MRVMEISNKELLIVKQNLLDSTLGNIQKTVWRMCILILACKGLIDWNLSIYFGPLTFFLVHSTYFLIFFYTN